ncbi:DUF2316 family protein [Kitasatospora sp. NBC_00315]|uniref:DUF2316 family protein n=1 Tax=Kitasatospora sp. NBC_00315 TaxID=2975963 RepID=UPI003248EDE6
MTLNDTERRRTSRELKADLALSGLTPQEAAADLGFTAQRLLFTLDVSPGADPVDVWQLHDYLVRAAQDAGRSPAPATVLTEPARLLARRWFRLREAPRHDFGSRTLR